MKGKLKVKVYFVPSDSQEGLEYKVTRHSDGLWSCKRKDNGYPCKAFLYGGMKGNPICKHIKQVK